jgi:CHAD domain-containing protein
MAYEISRARKANDPDSVHDLRVSIRRFASCLVVFRQFFPQKASKKVRQELRAIMKLAGEVRDRDIAIELAREAGLPAESTLVSTLAAQRGDAARQLSRILKEWNRRGRSEKWRGRLGV